MDIVCLGLSHHTAPVELREKFAVPEHAAPRLAAELARQPGLAEAVIVSTCNRVEYYEAAEQARDALAALERQLALPAGDAFFRHAAERSVAHLFRVVSGLDSMVLGETEILGQVKKAYQAAHEAGATGRHLNKLFQRAFNVAKDIRTNTNIQRGAVSVGSVAVDLAERIFGRLGDCHVMILGAGETSELTAGALQARGVKAIFVANRSHERAVALAEKMGGKAIHFEDWAGDFHDVDILIGSTAAPHAVVTKEKLAPMMRQRPDRPLFCIDLAVPRDFDPAVNELDGVYLYDIDSLQQLADASLAVRRQEVEICERLIARHVAEFIAWLNASANSAALRAQPEGAKP
jgi:glutamyl-tRNA reductase